MMIAEGTKDSLLYMYDSSPGSSKLIRYSTMPPGKYLRYDVLGNLTSDSARNLLQFSWDYRNLMTQATMPGVTTGWYNTVDCRYDEAGNRLRKSYTWTYWVSCGGPGPRGATMISGPGGSDSLITDTVSGNPVDTFGAVPTDSLGGVTTTMNGGLITPLIGENSCPTSATSGTFYLYDQGNLLATFDAAGNVVDMYVVGPGGNRIATYYLNSDSSLNYFMPDHLGSTRVVMKGVPPSSTYPYAVSAYYNYYPFGQTQEAVTNYSSPNQWTNHEHDQHGSFDYYNFGARLYDPKVGLFLTPDKAGQFASGYVYGGNSPTIGADPDGNVFFMLGLPFISGFLFGGAFAAVEMDASHNWDNWFGRLLSHSLVGGFEGYAGKFGSGTNIGGSMIQGAGTGVFFNGVHNLIDKKDFSDHFGGALVSGAVGGLMSTEQFTNWADYRGWKTNRQIMDAMLAQGDVYGAAMFYLNRTGRHLEPWQVTTTSQQDPIVQTGGGHPAYTLHPDEGPIIVLEQDYILNGNLPKGGYNDWRQTDRLTYVLDHEYGHATLHHGTQWYAREDMTNLQKAQLSSLKEGQADRYAARMASRSNSSEVFYRARNNAHAWDLHFPPFPLVRLNTITPGIVASAYVRLY